MEFESPIFVIGNPRSGTTLFRLMLTSHPNICVAPECGFLQWWYEKYKNWASEDSSNKTAVGTFISDLSTSRKIETWQLDYGLLEKSIWEKRPKNYSELAELVYLSYAYHKDKDLKYWGDKNNYYIQYLELLYELFPKAKFLMIVRDVRDVACSYRGLAAVKTSSRYKPELPSDIETIASQWDLNNRRVLSFREALPKNQVSITRYEDLVVDASAQLYTLCRFLNLSFSEEMLQYYLYNAANREEPGETIDWKLKTLKEPDKTSIGRYQQELKADELVKIAEIAGQTAGRLGYDLSNVEGTQA